MRPEHEWRLLTQARCRPALSLPLQPLVVATLKCPTPACHLLPKLLVFLPFCCHTVPAVPHSPASAALAQHPRLRRGEHAGRQQCNTLQQCSTLQSCTVCGRLQQRIALHQRVVVQKGGATGVCGGGSGCHQATCCLGRQRNEIQVWRAWALVHRSMRAIQNGSGWRALGCQMG